MSIPSKEKVIDELNKHFITQLKSIPGKQILFTGTLKDGKRIIVWTPQSKLYSNGGAWVDLTTVQEEILSNSDLTVVAFRLEGNMIYYLNFLDLKPYLVKEAVNYNDHEGDHWKIYIWPNEIQVIGNAKRFRFLSNNLDDMKA